MSLLDCPLPPPVPKSARLVHFGDNRRPVVTTPESRESYLEKQRRSSLRQVARRSRQCTRERVVPLEEHLRQYFTLQSVVEG